ncbi:MAG: S8 family peptidase [Rhizobacter sp.]|nr:S8 family peptidase [Rhizobacter sp.]
MGGLVKGCLRAGVAVALSMGVWAAQAGPAAPVDGLIVKLKGAPAHERMAALGASVRAAEAERVQRLLQSERLTKVHSRPAGRDAQYLNFGRRLPVAEAQALAERLRQRPDVEWVELNQRERLLQTAVVPNDLYYDYRSPSDLGQWWLRPEGETAGGQAPSWGAPGVQSAWSLTTGQPSAVVAVLDTGITPHADLFGRLLQGYDFVSEVEYANDGTGRDAYPDDPGDWVTQQEVDNEPALFGTCAVQDSSWHGTIISGIVAAATNNGTGVAGISWNGRVLPVRVAGKCGATVLDIIDGMRWAAGLHVSGVPDNPNPARILNISFGGTGSCDAYQGTINELAAQGVVVVAAAGNEMGEPTRPAKCPGVVGVAALARDGLKAAYSNFGPQLSIATVGGDPNVDDGLLTLLNTGTTVPGSDTYGNVFGTSFATPVVSGVASLMLSANPALSGRQIIDGLKSTARPHVQSSSGVPFCSVSNPDVCVCTTSTCGAGVLDAEGAVRYALNAPLDTGVPASDGGGGALGLAWLAGLALAVWRLAALRGGGAVRAAGRG